MMNAWFLGFAQNKAWDLILILDWISFLEGDTKEKVPAAVFNLILNTYHAIGRFSIRQIGDIFSYFS